MPKIRYLFICLFISLPSIIAKPIAAFSQTLANQTLSNDQLLGLFPLRNEDTVRFVRMPPFGSDQSKVPLDYFDLVLQRTNNKILRFKTMPVPVYISTSAGPAFTFACRHSFEMWETASHGLVRFIQVDNPQLARIQVIFNHLGLQQSVGDCALGAHTVTRWQPNDNNSGNKSPLDILALSLGLKPGEEQYNVPAQVIEVNLDLIDSKPENIRLLVLQNMVAHELGHALGILAHSPLISDLMYRITDECSRISNRDLNTLGKLYQAPIDIPL